MAHLFDILHLGSSGARAAQFGVRTAGHNIANVSTPGFHRRVVAQEQVGLPRVAVPKVGDGVRIIGAHRVVNHVLDRSARNADARAAASEARANVLGRANVVFGDILGEGLSPALDRLLASFEELAAAPQDRVVRRDLLAAAERFATESRRYGQQITAIRADVDTQLATEVDQVNGLVRAVAEVNRLIGQTAAPSPDLLDRRDRLLEELAERVDIRTTGRDDGTLDVHLAEGGFTLVAGRYAAELTVAPDPAGARLLGLGFAGAQRDLTGTVSGGKIGGLLAARDQDLAPTLAGLDRFVFELVQGINQIHGAGFGLDGQTGRPLFRPLAGADGAASRLELDPTVASNPALVAAAETRALAEGGNGVALALAAFRHSRVVQGMEPVEGLQSLLQGFGDGVYRAEIAAVSNSDASSRLRELQQSVSGVSLDEEMTEVIRYRQAYAAAVQVMQTADQLLQELMSLRR